MLSIYMDKFLESDKSKFKTNLIYAKIRIFYNLNFWRNKIEKNKLFTHILHVNCSKLHQNWYQCKGNLILSYMTPNSRWFDVSVEVISKILFYGKKGNNFGRPLGFKGDRNKFSRAHLWIFCLMILSFKKTRWT